LSEFSDLVAAAEKVLAPNRIRSKQEDRLKEILGGINPERMPDFEQYHLWLMAEQLKPIISKLYQASRRLKSRAHSHQQDYFTQKLLAAGTEIYNSARILKDGHDSICNAMELNSFNCAGEECLDIPTFDEDWRDKMESKY